MVDVAENDTYTPVGEIGVTTLIDSPRIRILKKHCNYTEDVSELVIIFTTVTTSKTLPVPSPLVSAAGRI